MKRSFLLAHHRKASKLPTFLREYDKVARLCAAEGVDYRLKFAGDVDHRAKTVRKGLSGSIRVVHTGRNKSSIQKAIRV